MVSLSPEEINLTLDWGRNELIKSLKNQQAFNIFQTEIESGTLNIQSLSRKLTLKLGTKNGQFTGKLQKFIKTLKQGEPTLVDQNRDNQGVISNENKPEETPTQNKQEPEVKESQTIIETQSNLPGATTISRTVLTSDGNQQKTLSITISFDDTQDKNESHSEDSDHETEAKPAANSTTKDEIDEIDSEQSDTFESTPLTPEQQYLEMHKRLLYAREEARFKAKQQMAPNMHKFSLQPRLWNLFMLEQESEHNEEEEIMEDDASNPPNEADSNNKLPTKSWEIPSNQSSMPKKSSSSYSTSSSYSYSSTSSDSYSDDSKHRRHHKHRKHSRH